VEGEVLISSPWYPVIGHVEMAKAATGRLRLNIGQYFFAKSAVQHWNRLPGRCG